MSKGANNKRANANQHDNANLAKELLTINDCLRWATSRFREAKLFYGHGTDSAWDEAVHLVLQLLHLPLDIDDRILNARLTLNEREYIIRCIYRRVVERRPLPYLTHCAWFAGQPFYVDERVVIPRSPFGELISNYFQPWVELDKVTKILDLCTGSGCMAITCADIMPQASIVASDFSFDALEVARKNIHGHQKQGQIELVQSDLFVNLEGEYFDLIIANPPYVDASDYESMPAEFHKEPTSGLAGGQDGLAIVRRILRDAPYHLNPEGVLIVEVGNSQQALQETFPHVPFTWLMFENGGDGVFLLTAEMLLQYHEDFLAASQ